MSGFITCEEDRDLLLARIALTSIIRINLMRTGLGLGWFALNLPSRKQSVMWSGLICTLILLRISRTALMSFCTLSCFGVLVGLSLIPYNKLFDLRSGVCWIQWVVLIGPLILTPELVDCQFY